MERPPETPTLPEVSTNIESVPEAPEGAAETPAIQESSPPIVETEIPETPEAPSGPEDDSRYDTPLEVQAAVEPPVEPEDDSRYDVPAETEDCPPDSSVTPGAHVGEATVELPVVEPETSEPPKDFDTVRDAMLDTAENQKLRNHLDALYRPGATEGDGGSADALFHEKETGELVGGKPHGEKVENRANGLGNLLAEGGLDATDLELAKNELEALQNARNFPRK